MRFRSISRSDVLQLLLLLSLLTAVRSSLADHYYVPTGSMEYTLMPGDRVLVDKTAYGLRVPLTTVDILGSSGPERGDVAVFDSPRDGTRLIKRVVAVGGDTVSLVGGQLWINGKRYGDKHIEWFEEKPAYLNLNDGGGPDVEDLELPAGTVLVLGDHRGNSLDGRYFGLVSESELVGRALGIFYRRGEGFVWKSL